MRLLNATLQEYGAVEGAAAAGIDVKTVSVGTARAEILRQKDTALGTVVENRIISGPNAPAKHHIGECPRRSTISNYFLMKAKIRVRLARQYDLQGGRLLGHVRTPKT